MIVNKNKWQSRLFVAISVFVFIFPLMMLFKMAFVTDGTPSFDNFINVFSSKRTLVAIKNTFLIGIGSTIVSALLGGVLAVVVAYTNIKFKKWIELLVIIPYVIPGYVITLSWISVFSANSPVTSAIKSLGIEKINVYSMTGIILILGISNAALVYLNLIDILRKVPKEQEWASLISGYSVRETLKNINLKSLKAPLLTSVVLAFLSAIDNFAIPLTLGAPSGISVLSTYIYEKAIGFGPTSFNEAAVLSIVLSVISFLVLYFQWRILTKTQLLETIQKDNSHRIKLKKHARKLTQWGVIALLFSINIVPLIFMFLSSLHQGYVKSILDWSHFSLGNYQFILTTPSMYTGFLVSLKITFITIIICLLVSLWVMYSKRRLGNKGAMFIEMGASLTYSIPGIVLALSMIFYWGRVPTVYGTLSILVISYVTRYILLMLKGLETAFIALGEDLEEASIISGAGFIEKWQKIILPLIKDQIFSSSFLIFVGAFTELTLSSLLAPANSKTVGLTIFSLQTSGDNNVAQAYSVIITLFILLLLIVRTLIEKGETAYD